MNLVVGIARVEVVIVKHLFAKDKCLINKDAYYGLTFEMPCVTDCYIVPVISGGIEKIVNVLDCVIKIHSQEGIGESEAQSIV